MDQLFLMQRYWGSDEEDDSKEENNLKINSSVKSKTLSEKQKSDIPLIDLDNDDCMLFNKKQKLNTSFKTNNKKNNIDNCDISINEQNSDSSISDIEIVNDTKSFNKLENVNNTEDILKGTVNVSPKLKATKNQKSKDTKLHRKNEEIAAEKNDTLNILLNANHSVKNANNNKCNFEITDVNSKIDSKKEKKRSLRYFEFEQNDESTSTEQDQIINDTFVSKDTEVTASDVKSKKRKKSKLKEELNDSDVNTAMKGLDREINFNSKKTPELRYFDLKETNSESISMEQDETDEKVHSPYTMKDKITENSLNGVVDVNNKIKSKNVKKSKLKSQKMEESNMNDVIEDGNMDSQDVGNEGEMFPIIGHVYKQKDEIVRHTLPHWLSNPTYISVNLQEKETPVSELKYLDLNTKNNLTKAGIKFLFPVQLAVIPWLMQSKEQSLLVHPSDICVSAPTGSGKTLAFVLPIVQSLKDSIVCAVRALVVLPVSELAIQVHKVFETYIKGTELKVALLTGKKSFVIEQNLLVKSTGQSAQSLVDIIVATPGRVLDHIYRTQGFCLKRLRYLVIDEADRMMEEIQQGWLKQVEEAVFRDCNFPNCVCSSYKRTFFEPTSAYNFGFISQPLQKLLYSATLTHDPEKLHTLSLYKPKLFTASSISSEKKYIGSCAVPSGINMLQVICEEGVKPMVICHLIKLHKFKRVLCFTETVERAHRLHLVLEEMGLLQVREISSFNRAIQRKIVLEQFSSGKIDVLVCSDLVARGIDIKNIDCVISYDIPQHVKIYIHRIGRTARAGKTGTAVALLSEGEIPRFRKILNHAEIKLPEKIYINSEDLKPLVESFQNALSVADAKLKKEKHQFPGKSSKKAKRK